MTARGFISRGVARFTAGPGIALKLAHEARSLDGKPDYYVFNNGTDGGYIVVSGDDRTIPVWGYSTSGTFDYESLPENAKWWLSEYQRQRQYLRDHPEVKPRQVETLSKSVDKLLTTQWNQNLPYNRFCPEAKSNKVLYYYDENDGIYYYNSYWNRACAGCSATALAQIMNYHKWPITGTGSKTYESVVREYVQQGSNEVYDRPITLSRDFSSQVYRWDYMKDIYGNYFDEATQTVNTYFIDGSGNWNFDELPCLTVAKLLYDVGIAVKTRYGATGIASESANANGIKEAMEQYFNYVVSVKKRGDIESVYVIADNWDELLRNELDANRPIFYRGQSSEDVHGEHKRHAFVFDGYDNEGRFHVNWGWSGDKDDYFFSTLLEDKAGYEEDHTAIFLTPGRDRKSLSVSMPKGNAGKVFKGGVKANLPFTVYGNNLDRNVTFTLSGPDADQFDLSPSYITASMANSRWTCRVSYQPTRVGAHTAQLTVSSSSDVTLSR